MQIKENMTSNQEKNSQQYHLKDMLELAKAYSKTDIIYYV